MPERAKPLIVDLHIPYCIRPERYSHAFGEVGSNAQKDAYMKALMREVRAWEGELDGYEVRAVRLGGGSASVMNPDLLGETLSLVRHTLPMAVGAEVSFDALPNTVGTPSLTGIAAGRPTRIELMMRSESDAELRALDCAFTMEDTRNAMLFLNRFHMNDIGLTLSYGIPGQTQTSWHNTLHAATIMQPHHISVDPLSVTDAEGMPGEEERFAMFAHACEFLEQNGYAQYAAGRFCRAGHEYLFDALRRNGVETVGMGVGAVSVLGGYVTRNTNNVALYLKNAGDFEKQTAQAFEADEAMLMREYARGRLSLTQGLLTSLFEARFGCALPKELSEQMGAFVGKGWLEQKDDGWCPTRRGLFIAQNGGLMLD